MSDRLASRSIRVLIVASGFAVAAVGTAGCSSTSAGPAARLPSAASPLVLAPIDPARASGPPAAEAIRPVASAPATFPTATTAPTRSASSTAPAPGRRSSTPARDPVIATPTPRSTCVQVNTRVLRGSAAFGREFAALQFTNTGRSACRLNGYPTVTLVRRGAPIGSPSQPATAAASTYLLAPGATAESQVNDYTSCQAPLSEEIRVVLPGSSQHAVRPGQLRACTLRVSALAAPQ